MKDAPKRICVIVIEVNRRALYLLYNSLAFHTDFSAVLKNRRSIYVNCVVNAY